MKLYAIDQQQYQAAYDQAQANLNVAKSNLAKAQQDADRYMDLAKNDAVARQTLEHAQADLESAKMQVAAAEATVKSVETNLRYSTIYAPFDGTIGISLVKLGSAVSPGQTVLNTISSDDPIAVDCAVDEKQISRFNALLQSSTNGKDSTLMIVLPDQSLYPYPGRLSFLDRAVDPQTGTIRIRIIFPNPRRILKAGLTCNLRVRYDGCSGKHIDSVQSCDGTDGGIFRVCGERKQGGPAKGESRHEHRRHGRCEQWLADWVTKSSWRGCSG